MKLQKTIERLQKLHPKEIDLSLDRTKNLCKKLGNPQNKINCISIIGTNGKYSTIQAMYSIFKQADYKCNIYTSPHIQKINERFIYNNEELNDDILTIKFREAFTPRRGRINCSLNDNGKWRWLGTQFVIIKN